jgi:hypothetical protein
VEYTNSTNAASYFYDGEGQLTKLTDWLDGCASQIFIRVDIIELSGEAV